VSSKNCPNTISMYLTTETLIRLLNDLLVPASETLESHIEGPQTKGKQKSLPRAVNGSLTDLVGACEILGPVIVSRRSEHVHRYLRWALATRRFWPAAFPNPHVVQCKSLYMILRLLPIVSRCKWKKELTLNIIVYCGEIRRRMRIGGPGGYSFASLY
jgi:hypothetical protein